MVRKSQKVSWTIYVDVLKKLEDEKVKLDQFRKQPLSISKLASAHLRRSLNIPCEVTLND